MYILTQNEVAEGQHFGKQCVNSYIVNIVWIYLDPEQDCINNYGSPPNFADDLQQVLVQK